MAKIKHNELAYNIRLELLISIDKYDLVKIKHAGNYFCGQSFKNAVEQVTGSGGIFQKVAVANQLQNLIRDGYVTVDDPWRYSVDGASILNSDDANEKVSLSTKGREHLQSLYPTPAEAEAIRLAKEANKLASQARIMSIVLGTLAIIASICIALWIK